MKFIDEALITVSAGKGGNGCLSFRREKFVPRGGPDGGDGGDGGSIYFEATPQLGSLIDFRYQRSYQADHGQSGMGKQQTGKKGEDLVLPVPLGTVIFDHETNTPIGDLTKPYQRILIAQGGFHGLGNARYKSSVNRAPRQTSSGSLGAKHLLRLELQLMADVGLLGLPNAGKSTLIRSVSSARPKVADYPFTTMRPHLGVIRMGNQQSFVMADIPGIIEGAAEGAGLGLRFLKHLSRTRFLLHLVDICPPDEQDPLIAIETIVQELEQYSAELAAKPRWLVFNKVDLLSPEESEARIQSILDRLAWTGPVFKISAISKMGTDTLCQAIMQNINEILSTLNTSEDILQSETSELAPIVPNS